MVRWTGYFLSCILRRAKLLAFRDPIENEDRGRETTKDVVCVVYRSVWGKEEGKSKEEESSEGNFL